MWSLDFCILLQDKSKMEGDSYGKQVLAAEEGKSNPWTSFKKLENGLHYMIETEWVIPITDDDGINYLIVTFTFITFLSWSIVPTPRISSDSVSRLLPFIPT